MIKKTLRASALLMVSFFTAAAFADTPAPESSTLRDSASSVMSSLISTGKNLVGGITDGVTKGRESTESSDGAVVLSGLEPMTEMLTVELLSVAQLKDGSGENVLIGFKNNTNKPVRLINLKQTGTLLVIEQGGYSSALLPDLVNPDEVTIPANTGVRQNFVFEDLANDIKSVRLFGKDLVLVK